MIDVFLRTQDGAETAENITLPLPDKTDVQDTSTREYARAIEVIG